MKRVNGKTGELGWPGKKGEITYKTLMETAFLPAHLRCLCCVCVCGQLRIRNVCCSQGKTRKTRKTLLSYPPISSLFLFAYTIFFQALKLY